MSESVPGQFAVDIPDISPEARKALELLEITTLQKLATSQAFVDATTLVAATNGLQSNDLVLETRYKLYLKEEEVEEALVRDIAELPIKALKVIPDDHASDIAEKLGVSSIRELANYQPYQIAKRVLQALNPPKIFASDPGQMKDLVPKAGEYPVEKVEYTNFVLGKVIQQPKVNLVDVNANSFSAPKFENLPNSQTGFKSVAYGALLTFSQSWYTEGVARGQLLHSIALAPGESTRVAIIDWSRQERGVRTEQSTQKDELSSTVTLKRAIDEVVNALAQEAQSGFAKTNASGSTRQRGKASAIEHSGGLLGGLFGASLPSQSQSSSESHTTGQTKSESKSSGRRDIASNMLQNAVSRTHQVAHDSRARHASVVQDVSESEKETVNTRVVTNYNHMHALSIQYYEVVQIYRVKLKLKTVDNVIFFPVELPDLADPEVRRRFSHLLPNTGLAPPAPPAPSTNIKHEVEISLEGRGMYPVTDSNSVLLSYFIETFRALASQETRADALVKIAEIFNDNPPDLSEAVDVNSVYEALNRELWLQEETDKASGIVGGPILRPGKTSLFLPAETNLRTAYGESYGSGRKSKIKALVRKDRGDERLMSAYETIRPNPLSSIDHIALSTAEESTTPGSWNLVLDLEFKGTEFSIRVPPTGLRTKEKPVIIRITPSSGVASESSVHQPRYEDYTQAIMRSFNAPQISSLLSGYGIQVKNTLVPLADIVDPVPVGNVGNYLAFKTKFVPDEKTWSKTLEDNGFVAGTQRETHVPLSSGGVFAEGVLGLNNCAEKLDMTRFWNWNDSPPLFKPTEIAAVKTGTRKGDVDLTPGQFSNPIINISQPAALPAPTGMSSVLSAISSGDIFRNMSGLDASAALNQALIQANQSGASDAAQNAAKSLENILQANTDRFKAVTEMTTSLASSGAGVLTSRNTSEEGAKYNELLKMMKKHIGEEDGGDEEKGGRKGKGGGKKRPKSGEEEKPKEQPVGKKPKISV